MTINQRVQSILSASSAARNSDKELWIIYAQKSGLELSDKQIECIRSMPEFETLRRVRQKIQAVGQYRADSVVEQARKYKAIQTRQRIPFMDAEDIEYTFDGRRVLPYGE